MQVDQLRVESDILKNLKHENVVSMLEGRAANGLPEFILEWLPFGLEDFMANSHTQPPDEWWPTAVKLSRHLVNGLAFIHEKGVSMALNPVLLFARNRDRHANDCLFAQELLSLAQSKPQECMLYKARELDCLTS